MTAHAPSRVKADHTLTYVPTAMAPTVARIADTVAVVPTLTRRMYSAISSGLRT